MTKKAANILERYEKVVKAEVNAVECEIHSKFDFSEAYIEKAYDEFFEMILGMYRFEMIKKSDLDEMEQKAHSVKRECLMKLHDLKAAR